MIDDEDKTTTNHDVIKKWVEKRDGKPAIVRGTYGYLNHKGLLHIAFPGYKEAHLEEISWNEFFRIFDNKHFVFLFQDIKRNGELSYFCKIISKTELHYFLI